MFDVQRIRRDFPLLSQKTAVGVPYVYLDNAATSQKPRAVLDAVTRFYETENAAVHRAMHELSERATVAYEDARTKVQHFIGAKSPEEIIFTKNATEAINLVAHSFGSTLKKGDAVIVSILEHHSNIIPWQQLKERIGIEILWLDCDDVGELDRSQYEKYLADKNVKLVALTGQSNVLGVRPDLGYFIPKAKEHGAKILIDAAQLIAHSKIDVATLDCDFLAFSGHKVFGPTGIGVLYGKKEILETLPPFLGGGQMVQDVTKSGFTPADLPQRFEAGTPPVAEAIGLAAAIDWLHAIPAKAREEHEEKLLQFAADRLSAIPGLHILGPLENGKWKMENRPSGSLSFTLDSIHPHDLTELLGRQGLCLRAGHHCAQPLHERLGVPSSTRLSVALYTTEEEIEKCAEAIISVQRRFLK